MKITRKAAKVLAVVIAAVVVWAALTGRFVMIFAEAAYLSALVHRPVRYEIADSYQGWVTITYKKPGCEPLDRSGFCLVGTSDSDPLKSWRRTEYVYVAGNGSKTLISPDMILAETAGHSSDAAEPYEEQSFFVGTSEALKKAWSKEPR